MASFAGVRNMKNCAIVLEDNPKERMEFQFWEQQIEESYALEAYQTHGGKRTPQPTHITYMGGNWSAMNLTLHFQADGRTKSRPVPGRTHAADIEGVLVDMERTARWFESLAFPQGAKGDKGLQQQLISRADGPKSGRGKKLTGLFTSDDAVAKAKANLRANVPPIFLVVFGRFLTVRGYLTNVALNWKPPFHPVTVRPYSCTVTMSLQRLEKGELTLESIRNMGGAREQTSTVSITGSIPLLERSKSLARLNLHYKASVMQKSGNYQALNLRDVEESTAPFIAQTTIQSGF